MGNDLDIDIAADRSPTSARGKSWRRSHAGRRSLDAFAHFLAHFPGLLCTIGFDGRLKKVNSSQTEIWGWRPEQLKTGQLLEFVHPEDREVSHAMVAELGRSREMVTFENRCSHRDGTYRWQQWTVWLGHKRLLLHAAARDITELREAQASVATCLEQERARLGRQLHDGLFQALASVSVLSAKLVGRLAGRAAAADAAEIATQLADSVCQVRGLVHELSPPNLDHSGLDGALTALVTDVRQRFGIACLLQCERPFPRLDPDIEQHLYRIAQEALENAVDHGQARRIRIRLHLENGAGVLRIRDDGIGMGRPATHAPGTGLRNMANRALLCGGNLIVQPGHPQGTEIHCTFLRSQDPRPHGSGQRGHDVAAATGRPRKTLLIVDSSPVFRRGMSGLIESAPELAIGGEAAGSHAALALIRRHAPDLVLVDIMLDRSDGLDLLRQMKERHPQISVLVISMCNEDLYAERALRLGARGYISKSLPGEQILAAIRHVLSGQLYLSGGLRSRLAERVAIQPSLATSSPIAGLSDRELQVFRLMGQGLSTREIAQNLHLSVKTIETHREKLKRKLGLKSGVELSNHACRWVQSEHLD